jgi:hypothetical protein
MFGIHLNFNFSGNFLATFSKDSNISLKLWDYYVTHTLKSNAHKVDQNREKKIK